MNNFVLSLLLLSSTKDFTAYWGNDQISVYRDKHDCRLVTNYSRGTILTLDYDRALMSVNVTIEDEKFESVEDRSQYNFRVIFYNAAVGKQVNVYPDVRGSGIIFRQKDGKVSKGVTFELSDPNAVQSFRGYKTFGVMRGHVVVSSFDLTPLRSALGKLVVCASERARVSPSDPLESSSDK